MKTVHGNITVDIDRSHPANSVSHLIILLINICVKNLVAPL